MINTTEEYKEALAHISEKVRDGKFLEIGSHEGESACVLAKYASSLVCVDPWPQQRYKKTFKQRAKDSGLEPIITGMQCKSSDYFEAQKKSGIFDLIYIDGCHFYDVAKIDFTEALRLIKPNGIIMVHDCVGDIEDYPNGWLQAQRNKPKMGVRDLFPSSSPGWIHAGVNLLVEEHFGEVEDRFKELVYFRMED